MKSLLKVSQVADILNVSPKTVRNHINAGRLPVVALGSTSRGDRVRPEDVDKLQVELTVCKEAAKCRSTQEEKKVFTGVSSSTTARELDVRLGQPANERLKNSSAG